MQVGNISFAGKVGFNINSDEVKRIILGDLEKSYGLKIIAKHYDKFEEERSIQTLNRNPHMICLRSNGNPYFLHLVKYNFTNYCMFVDKKIQQGYYYPRMIISRFSFDDYLFENGGTLLEGEMIKSDAGWYFSIIDIYVHGGTHLIDMNLPKRINILYKILKENHFPDETDVCKFRIKRYFTYDDYGAISEHIDKLPYSTRGLIFRPLFFKFKDILLNFNDSLIVKVERKKVGKFMDTRTSISMTKSCEVLEVNTATAKVVDTLDNNSISDGEKVMLVQKGNVPDVYILYDPINPLTSIGTACIQTLAASKKMREIFINKNSIDKVEIKCKYMERFEKWTPCL